MTPFISKTELDIIQADNVSLIRYYTLPDGTQGLLLIYDGKRFINLCEYDDYWQLLTHRADSLYLEYPNSCMDDHTRNILESRKNSSCLGRFDFLTGTKRYTEKLVGFGTSAFSENLVGYFLSEIYKDIETDFTLIGIKGYRDRFSVLCKVNGAEKTLPCEFSAAQNEYTYCFGNIFTALNSAQIRVKYGFGCIEITTDTSTKRTLRNEYRYDLINKNFFHRVWENGQVLFIDEQSIDLPEAHISEQTCQICGLQNNSFRGYVLPWNERVFLFNSDSYGEFISDNDGMLIQIYHEKLYNNESHEISATHEIFGRDEDILLIQSELMCDGSAVSTKSDVDGFYYRYIGKTGAQDMAEYLTDVTSAPILDNYLQK